MTSPKPSQPSGDAQDVVLSFYTWLLNTHDGCHKLDEEDRERLALEIDAYVARATERLAARNAHLEKLAAQIVGEEAEFQEHGCGDCREKDVVIRERGVDLLDLRAQVERLRKLLQPFAEFAAAFKATTVDSEEAHMSKTVKELAREACGCEWCLGFGGSGGYCERRLRIERVLVEHEKAVREEDHVAFMRIVEKAISDCEEARRMDGPSWIAFQIEELESLLDTMRIRARRPADAKEGA